MISQRLAATGPRAIKRVSSLLSPTSTTNSHLPEVPPSNNNLATMLTIEDLAVKLRRAVVIAEVKADLPVLVLNNKLNAQTAGPGTHGFQLQRRVVAREHAAVLVASVVHEAAGFFPVGPFGAAGEAFGRRAVDAEGENAGDGSDDRGGLHLC
jgi:hypothetical protein